MRKRILFIIGCLDSGGVAKSLVTLMNVIDKKKYDIHLLILSAVRGPFVQYLPDDITIHGDERIEGLVDGIAGLRPLVKKGHVWLALCSIFRMLFSLFDKSSAGWMLAKFMPRLGLGEFDVVVDYGGQHLLYYMVDKIKSKRKVSYFHSDYSKWDYYYRIDKKLLPRVDKIVLVSETCKKSMASFFPSLVDKMCVIENIVSPVMLQTQSLEKVSEEAFFKGNNVLLTVGHVCKNKGFDLILDATRIMKQHGADFKWILIGTYDEYSVRQVKESGLDNDILFYGLCSNPYPYFRMSDIIVHPSRFEGKPMVVCEAKVLCKPIVATCFSSVQDVLQNNINASICEMNAASLADKIEELMRNKRLRARYVQNLQEHLMDNSDEVEKLYAIFEGE